MDDRVGRNHRPRRAPLPCRDHGDGKAHLQSLHRAGVAGEVGATRGRDPRLAGFDPRTSKETRSRFGVLECCGPFMTTPNKNTPKAAPGEPKAKTSWSGSGEVLRAKCLKKESLRSTGRSPMAASSAAYHGESTREPVGPRRCSEEESNSSRPGIVSADLNLHTGKFVCRL